MRQCRITFILVAVSITGCGSDTTAEDRIRAVLSAAEQAVEERSTFDFSKHLTVNYKDKLHMNRRAAVRSLFGYFHQHRSIHLFTRIASLEIDNDLQTATAGVYVAMAGVPVESIDALLSMKADLYRFDLDLLLVKDEWKINYANWRTANISDL